MKIGVLKCTLGLLALIGLQILRVSYHTFPSTLTAVDHQMSSLFLNQRKTATCFLHPKWQLVWRDEFEGEQVNRSKWTLEEGWLDKNNELQFYHPNQVKVDQGKLRIETNKSYQSGALHTKDKWRFLYGRVEIRARLPRGQGIFPAFWMLPNQDETWLPEIDIIELLGHEPDRVWMVVHGLENDRLRSDSASFKGPDFSETFHTFVLEWSKDELIWLIDGVERYRTTSFVPQVPMYLYLNTAVGGDWPGSPDETTKFPQTYEVDYIRVYQLKEGER
ncbi:glycoside hydrolase family 16 protein [Amphibacillus cookii]|uniref:glycoside hydrolase family 16 protein n=1 Tax=Amphibacillus cookii TaxID=767787 RepID=UPI0019585D56|nr:glycoside hydrolase family 16 protein [Amphibacillus cookii]MBM7539855.1 beta-glucanase (GH16 family) [Amphibacillus cookii]